MRSILLTKMRRGTPYLSACRHTVSLCGSTPDTESNTATAPSSTRSERSTCAATTLGSLQRRRSTSTAQRGVAVTSG